MRFTFASPNGVDGVQCDRTFPWSMKCFGNLSMKFLKLELTIDSIPDNEHAGIILINATWITTMMNLEYLSIRMWCCFPLRMSWLKWNFWNILKFSKFLPDDDQEHSWCNPMVFLCFRSRVQKLRTIKIKFWKWWKIKWFNGRSQTFFLKYKNLL